MEDSDTGNFWWGVAFRLVPNHLDGFTGKADTADGIKPGCVLSGQNGNIFNLAGIVERTLLEHGLAGQAEKMKTGIFSGSYTEAGAAI